MGPLALSDAEQIIQLISDVSDPSLEIELIHRKKLLVEGVAKLVAADVYVWSSAVISRRLLPGSEQSARDVMTTCWIEGGWANEEQRASAYAVMTDPAMNEALLCPLLDAVEQGRYQTFLRRDVVADAEWEKIGKPWMQAGLGFNLLCAYPVSENIMSGIGLHRFSEKPDFIERDRSVVHVAFHHVDWLHRCGTNLEIGLVASQLSQRKRQVLLHLLKGNSAKGIANKLSLSGHTVDSYVKEIYRHFEVNGKRELQSKFLVAASNSTE